MGSADGIAHGGDVAARAADLEEVEREQPARPGDGGAAGGDQVERGLAGDRLVGSDDATVDREGELEAAGLRGGLDAAGGRGGIDRRPGAAARGDAEREESGGQPDTTTG